jgi:hypothetical protein
LEGILAHLHVVEEVMRKAHLVWASFSQGSNDEEDGRCQYL